jgi:osmotically-inducible protein OsmY
MTQTPARTDAQLQAAVTDELEWTPSVNSARIGVAVDHGTVTLSGEVETYPQRLLAEKAALRVRGVTAVAEEVTVQNSWAERTDTDVAREATEALERAVEVPSGSVKAVVRDHHITLSGEVPWHFQREAAERAVRYTRGVFGVSNTIGIRPTVPAAGLESAITAALVRNAQLEGKDIMVMTDAGHVTLQGTVHSWSERHQADTAAWSAPGVTAVTNHLQISN